MNDLGNEARAFLVKARGAHDAPHGAKERVRAGLASALVASAGVGGTGDVAAARGAHERWVGAAKLGGIVAALGAGALLALLSLGHAKPVRGPASAPAVESIASSPPRAPAASPWVEVPPDEVTPSSSPPASSAAAAPAPRPSPAAAAPRVAAPDDSVAAEVALLRKVSASLRAGDPASALSGVAEHARRFPNGALAEERDMERILALCALGRRDEAARATDRFTRAYPSSSHEARIRAACAAPAPSDVAP